MLAIFEVQTHFFEFNPFREPTGDEQDEAVEPNGPSFPSSGMAESSRNPSNTSATPSLRSFTSAAALASSTAFASKSTPVLSLSAPSNVPKRPLAIYKTTGSPSPKSPQMYTSSPKSATEIVRRATTAPPATISKSSMSSRSGPVAPPRRSPTAPPSTLHKDPAQHSPTAQLTPSSTSPRLATKPLPPPPTNLSSLASKHPSQRLTPEEMRTLWDALEDAGTCLLPLMHR